MAWSITLTLDLVETPTDSPTDVVEVDRVMGGLRATARSRRTHGLDWRRAQLAAMARLIEEHESELIEALAEDTGKSSGEALLGDLLVVKAAISDALSNLRKWTAPQRVSIPMFMQPGKARVRPEPRGVVAVIGPWNYPVHLTLLPAVQAISAGNCVVMKPSEMTPRTAALLAEIVPAHLDRDAIAVVTGGPEETTAIIENDPDLVFFTGSTNVGRKIAEAAAPRLIPVVLELGGKSPVIVAADADVTVAARRIVHTKTLNSGQTCVAADYVLAERSILPALVEALRAEMTHREVQYEERTKIVNEGHAERLARLLENHGGRSCRRWRRRRHADGGADPDPGARRRRRRDGRGDFRPPPAGVGGRRHRRRHRVRQRPTPPARAVRVLGVGGHRGARARQHHLRRRLRQPRRYHLGPRTCPSVVSGPAAWVHTTARPGSTPSATNAPCSTSPRASTYRRSTRRSAGPRKRS
ncbi:MAG: aldehyde dehydrogenase family protein [Acidimicrobiales bacterium]|nr:aldehyde dehydrogenase family protein [Acidimicrobiales bacterium]